MNYFREVGTDVLVRLQLGDESAFRVIYDRYSPSLYHFAFSFLRDKELSEEVVQECLLKLWINRLNVDENVPLGPYLYTIARRLSLNMLRYSINSSHAHQMIKQASKEGHNETEERILLNDLSLFAESVLIALPAKQQEVFRLSRHDGLSHKQIAKHLQLSENTVRNHISAALKKMQIKFDKSYLLLLVLALLK